MRPNALGRGVPKVVAEAQEAIASSPISEEALEDIFGGIIVEMLVIILKVLYEIDDKLPL